MPARRQRRTRKLCCEALEDRCLFTTDYAVEFALTDPNGNPITGELYSGESFELAVYVQDLRGAAATGLVQAYVSFNYSGASLPNGGQLDYSNSIYNTNDSFGTVQQNTSTTGSVQQAGGDTPAFSAPANPSAPNLLFAVPLVANGSSIQISGTAVASPGFIAAPHTSVSNGDVSFSGTALTGQNVGTGPGVVSINLADSNPTNGGTNDQLHWTVTFSAPVSGVSTGAFTAVPGGNVTGASVLSVSPTSGLSSTYTVAVNAGSGTGTLGLNLTNGAGIADASSNPLAGPGSAGDSPAVGQVYTVNKVSAPTLSVTDASGAYTSSAFVATAQVNGQPSLEGVTPSLAYYSGTAATGTALAVAPSLVGTYTVLASFAGSTDYSSTSASTTFSITLAAASLSVSDAGGTYDPPLTFPANDSVAGVGSQSTSAPSLEGVTPTLTYYSGTTTTGTGATSAPSAAGTYTVLASFSGSTDYATASNTAVFSIAKAAPVLTVSDSGGTFNGLTHPASDSVAGVGNQSSAGASLEGVTPALAYYSGTAATGTPLSGTPLAIGSYTALVSFAGSTDYTGGSSSATFAITGPQGAATLTLASGTYTSAPLPPQVAGIGSQSTPAASLEGVSPTATYYSGTAATGTSLTSPPSTAGTYTAVLSFAGSTDYGSAGNTVTFSIAKAAPLLAVTDAGGPFNGSPYPAVDTVAGVGSQSTAGHSLEGVTPTLAYYSGTAATGTALGAAPSGIGTYTALASFAGSTDYTSGSSSATFAITGPKGTATLTVTSGTYTSSPLPPQVTGIGSQSTPAASLEGVSPTATYYSGTAATGTSLTNPPSTAGTYTAVLSFAGSTDYGSAGSTVTFSIAKAAPIVAAADAGGPFNGAPYPANDTVAGVGSQSTAGPSLEGVTPMLTYYSGTAATGTGASAAPSTAGTYTAVASFTGSTDYTSGDGSVTFSITAAQVVPNLTVTDNSGLFTGSRFTANETVAGIGNQSTPGPSLEGVTPSLTYYSGTAATGTALGGAPSAVGVYTVVASFAGSTDYTTASASTTFAINSLTATTPTLSVSDAGGTYDPPTAYPASVTVNGGSSLEGVTPTLTYYSGTVPAGTGTSSAPSSAGTYTALASFVGSTDFTSASASATFTILKAAPLLSVTPTGGGPFSGSPYAFVSATIAGVGNQSTSGSSLEGTTPTITYYSGTAASGTPLSGPPLAIGTYVAVVSFAGSADYSSASSATEGPFTITGPLGAPVLTVSDAGGTYDPPTSFAAMATIAGIGTQSTPGTSLEGVTPTLTYFSGTAVTGTGTSAAPSTAGTYTVLASFAGSADYASRAASQAFTVARARPALSLIDAGGTYNPPTTFPGTVTVAGVGNQSTFGGSLEGVTPTLTYFSGTAGTGTGTSTAPSIAGTYTVVAIFPGSTDYTSVAASTTFTIQQAKPVVSVIDAGGTYDPPASFPASDTVAGVGSQSAAGASLESVTPTLTYYSGTVATGTGTTTAPSLAGTYTVVASFVGSTDYTSGMASALFTVAKAAPVVTVSDSGGSYDPPTSFPASAMVAGVGNQSAAGASLETVSPTLTYYSGTSATGSGASTAPSTAGTYTVVASFAGSADYSSGQASATFTVSRATPVLTLSDSGGVFNDAAFAATSNVAGIGSQSAPGSSLESVAPTLTYYSGAAATGTGTSSAPSAVGTYTVVASFAGSSDYVSAASSSITFSITKATPTVTVSDTGGTFENAPFTATALVAGAGGQSTPAASLESVTPTVTYYSGTAATGTGTTTAPSTVGTYTAVASFAGSADYNSAASGSTTFSIVPATPVVTVTDAGGVFNNSAFPATVTVNGSASLENVSPTLTYYSGTAATGTPLGAAPSAVGTYTAVGGFAGSTDYTSASGSTTFTISPPFGTLSGTVYFDANHSGALVAGDAPVGNITVTLTGTDSSGNGVNQSVTTAADGTYSFASVAGGTYALEATIPAYLRAGTATAGNQGGSATGETVANIVLAAGSSGSGYNFGVLGLSNIVASINLFLASTPPDAELLNPQFTITPLADESVAAGQSTSPQSFSIQPPLWLPGSAINVTGGTSVTSLVATNSIVYGGSGEHRTVTVTPSGTQTGSASITTTVSDVYGVETSESFTLTVTGDPATNPAVVAAAQNTPAVSPQVAAAPPPQPAPLVSAPDPAAASGSTSGSSQLAAVDEALASEPSWTGLS